MTEKQRVPLDVARAHAEEARALLAPACDRIEIAGSIRRGRLDVGDIELVCVPRLHYSTDLFGAQTGTAYNELTALCGRLIGLDYLSLRVDRNGRTAWGERYMRAWFYSESGDVMALDVFSVLPPAQWGVIFTIRTGPGEFSEKLVTARRAGGALPHGWKVQGGALHDAHGRVIETAEEADLFAALGLPVIPPAARTVERLRQEVLGMHGNDDANVAQGEDAAQGAGAGPTTDAPTAGREA